MAEVRVPDQPMKSSQCGGPSSQWTKATPFSEYYCRKFNGLWHTDKASSVVVWKAMLNIQVH